MPTKKQSIELITGHFKDLIFDPNANLISGGVSYPNISFGIPSGQPWIQLNVLPGDTEQKTLGAPDANTWRTPGVVMVRVNIPLGNGTELAGTIGELITASFQGKSYDGVTYRAVSLARVGHQGSFDVTVIKVDWFSNDHR